MGHKFPATLVYAVLTGEEQKLYGGTVLALHSLTDFNATENDIALGDVIDGVDSNFFAQVTRLTILAMVAVAMAPALPIQVCLKDAVTHNTTLSWAPVPGAQSYCAWWCDSPDPAWTHDRTHNKSAGDATSITLVRVNINDRLFGLSLVSRDGYESPVMFPSSERP